jgi:hypothetical protein
LLNATESVTNAEALQDAIKRRVSHVKIEGVIEELKSITLLPKTKITGVGSNPELRFKTGQPGILLGADCSVN